MQVTFARALLVGAGLLLAQQPGAAQTPIFLNINPSWSPDGRQLVFESRRHGAASLYIINADGSGERRLTWTLGDDTHPAWSPHGSHIVFDSNRDGAWNLYSIKPDGTDERRLTHPGANRRLTFARHPAWSPDSRRIVFDSDRDGDEEVYVMNADGSGATRLTNAPGRDGHASFTRDGQRVVFGS
ncbi:MAG: TolB family protein, partial [Gemmatimonadaceae bacterium]